MLIYQVEDRITLKKGRPCGENLWEILRTGVDIKLKCADCQHIIQLSRLDLEKRAREIQERGKLVSIIHHKRED